jgi:hypothetical protein
MADLVQDLGITADTIEFVNVGDLQKKRESSFIHPSDHNFQYLMNALFTPLDMTDYENCFVGWNELGGSVPINNYGLLKPLMEEPWPANHQLAAMESVEARPISARTGGHKEMIESRSAE